MIYINGISAITSQDTFDSQNFLEDVHFSEVEYLMSKEPNYKELLPARARRRMSKIVKMGVTSARHALLEAGIEVPDAIITGTGMGCLQDTEKFLMSIINDKEQFLTPISFIQSTHNTVGGTIALMLKCHNYNFTYVHRGFSFESALLDGILQLKEGEIDNALIGGIDEMTDHYYRIHNQLRFWKNTKVNPRHLLKYETEGALPGEGATFFVLSKEKKDNTFAQILGAHLLFHPKDNSEIINELMRFLENSGSKLEEIDAVVLGASGDKNLDPIYKEMNASIFADKAQTWYKHICGEHHTDSSFGLWVATQMVHKQRIPSSIRINKIEKSRIRKVLVYSHYRNANHVFHLVAQA